MSLANVFGRIQLIMVLERYIIDKAILACLYFRLGDRAYTMFVAIHLALAF
jgi:hypothetical protein